MPKRKETRTLKKGLPEVTSRKEVRRVSLSVCACAWVFAQLRADTLTVLIPISTPESELEVDSDDGGSDSDGTPSRARDESETEAARVVGGGYSNGDLESFLAAARSATEKEIIGCLGDVTCTLTRLKV